MTDVFISYSRDDKAFVRELHTALVKRERDAWVDWEGIPPTSEFLQEIYGAIEAADVFIFIISPDSVQSEVCRLEIEHAVEDNKRLVPIVRREVPAKQVHPRLAAIDWVFLRESDDFETAFDQLISALDTDLDWLRAHTRLLVRAKEWKRRDEDRSVLLRGRDLQEAERQLAALGDEEEPRPTELQREFLAASRTAARKARRRLIQGTSAAGLLAIVLTLAALWLNADNRVNAFLESDSRDQQFEQEKQALLGFPGLFVRQRLAARLQQLVSESQLETTEGPLRELKLTDQQRLDNGWQSAKAASALFHAGQPDSGLEVFRVAKNFEPLTQFVERCQQQGVSGAQLVQLLEKALELRSREQYDMEFGDQESTVCYGLLLALADMLNAKSWSLEDAVRQKLVRAYQHDPSSAIHGACRLLLVRAAGEDSIRDLDRRLASQHEKLLESATWQQQLRKREWFTIRLVQPEGDVYLTMVVFPAGAFQIGSAEAGEDDKFPNRFTHLEFPHRVEISQPFALSSREFPLTGSGVDWGQATAACDAATRDWAAEYGLGMTAWYDGPAEPGNGFRLSTDAEWEYACRAGTVTHFSFGVDETVAAKYAQFVPLGDELAPAKNGPLLPNCRGLFDMHGGQREWCHDLKRRYEEGSVVEDPGLLDWQWDESRQRVLRSFGPDQSLGNCRSASHEFTDDESLVAGFRFCLPLHDAPDDLTETSQR